jgi:hypothetical protein
MGIKHVDHTDSASAQRSLIDGDNGYCYIMTSGAFHFTGSPTYSDGLFKILMGCHFEYNHSGSTSGTFGGKRAAVYSGGLLYTYGDGASIPGDEPITVYGGEWGDGLPILNHGFNQAFMSERTFDELSEVPTDCSAIAYIDDGKVRSRNMTVSQGGGTVPALIGWDPVAGVWKVISAFGSVSTGLTIASGAITITGDYHRIDTENNDASDDLTTINGGHDAMRLTLRAQNSSRDVVIKDGTGNIQCAGDFTLNNTQDTITFIYDINTTTWLEISRSDNGA